MQYGGYGYGFFWFDRTYLLLFVGLAISLAASARVKRVFRQYDGITARCGMTGADVVRRILSLYGIRGVTVRRIPKSQADHYDSHSKTVNLSSTVYASGSISAIGMAAHECGHIIQDAKGYELFQIRSALLFLVNAGNVISLPMVIVGLLMGGFSALMKTGIYLYSFSVLFHLLTLPVELNASARAQKFLEASGMLLEKEMKQVRQVLNAAALIYVGSAATATFSLLFAMLTRGGQNND